MSRWTWLLLAGGLALAQTASLAPAVILPLSPLSPSQVAVTATSVVVLGQVNGSGALAILPFPLADDVASTLLPLPVPALDDPLGTPLAADGDRAVVILSQGLEAADADGAVAVIDLKTGGLLGTVPVGTGPAAVAVQGRQAWVVNQRERTISVLDLTTLTEMAIRTVDLLAPGFDDLFIRAAAPVSSRLVAMVIDPLTFRSSVVDLDGGGLRNFSQVILELTGTALSSWQDWAVVVSQGTRRSQVVTVQIPGFAIGGTLETRFTSAAVAGPWLATAEESTVQLWTLPELAATGFSLALEQPIVALGGSPNGLAAVTGGDSPVLAVWMLQE